jgi:hypothetical protein
VWQDNLGLSASALNGNGSGAATVVQADYLLWKTNFEALATGSEGTAAVPEPTTLLLALLVLFVVANRGTHNLSISERLTKRRVLLHVVQ